VQITSTIFGAWTRLFGIMLTSYKLGNLLVLAVSDSLSSTAHHLNYFILF